jgi:hypothetical protein
MPTRVRPPIWLWFNVLSLDAPLIALVWQDFLARCYPTTLLPQGRAVLGLTVWAIYLADRLLDVRHPASPLESLRHRFYRRNRVFGQTLFALVVAADLAMMRLLIRPSLFTAGLLLAGAVALYLGAFPLTGWGTTAWKKPLAALLFTAGTFVIAWTGTGHPVQELAWPALAFCALCLGNLLMIERWSQGSTSSSPRVWIWLMALLIPMVASHHSNWFEAIVFSAAGLCALAWWGRRMPWDARCVLADAVLLTPLLFR